MKLLKGAHPEYRGRNLCLGNARKYVFGDTDSQLKFERIRVPKHIFVCIPKKWILWKRVTLLDGAKILLTYFKRFRQLLNLPITRQDA